MEINFKFPTHQGELAYGKIACDHSYEESPRTEVKRAEVLNIAL